MTPEAPQAGTWRPRARRRSVAGFCYAPRMKAKPHIAIVGTGNLAAALARTLQRAGYRIDAVVTRHNADSLRRAKSLARHLDASAIALGHAQIASDIVWFCVPDAQISGAARSLAGTGVWKGRVAFHSSGALTSDELSALRQHGASVASVHPLMTFVRGSRPSLAGVPFATEGDTLAVRMATTIVKDLRGQAFAIKKQHKAAYHAWGTFASPLLTALLATTERIAPSAGMTRKAAKDRMLPIVTQTVANYAALGAVGAFSGPFVRGDVNTVNEHLRVLKQTPLAREVYVALAKAALEYLPAQNRNRLKKILAE
jgi:predicted short-subunit dehydrogenase-like oxidoreductase (DUF2520 family)